MKSPDSGLMNEAVDSGLRNEAADSGLRTPEDGKARDGRARYKTRLIEVGAYRLSGVLLSL